MAGAVRVLAIGGGLLWISLVLAGMKIISDFKTTPGAHGTAPLVWPGGSSLVPQPGRSTLLAFIHPRCPCSRASLSELNIIMNAAGERASAIVVFLHSDGALADPEHSDSWHGAGAIPNTVRFVDRTGAEAARFGALTSGHVVLYDQKRNLQFAGGITDSRGHEGDNMGRRAVLARLKETRDQPVGHDVFGCPLRDATDPEPNGQIEKP